MKNLILSLVLVLVSSAVMAQEGKVYVMNSATFQSHHGTSSTSNGEVDLGDVRAILVGNKFYISGQVCVPGYCQNLFEEYWIGEIEGSYVRVSSRWSFGMLVRINDDNPLSLTFTTPNGNYTYGFRQGVVAEINAAKWGEQHLTNPIVTGEIFLIAVNNNKR